ncbi:DNA-directed RNA polymerase sigma-70 factor [Bacteroidia bacterium]|nr:DNA-directed RNA polymerase sigma-70 factor [Bacteroidia bacterium]
MPTTIAPATPEEVVMWVKKAKNGDERAFAMLMERYREGIVALLQKRLSNSADIEDITQQTFAKAFEKIATYSPQYKFSTWLYRIARNTCIDFKRQNQNRTVSIENLSRTDKIKAQQFETSPEEDTIAAQDMALARLLSDKLKPQYQKIIRLRYQQEMTYAEIAISLNIPIGTVKTQLARAKEQLMKLLINNKIG